MSDHILEMKGITKYIFDDLGKGIRESGVRILDNVDFNLRAGEVHVLMGENGAGKSTLMKILSGIIPYDDGEIILNGEHAEFKGIKESRNKGISLIHQELNLCPMLDVGRNMFLGREPKRGLLIDNKKMYDDSQALLSALGLDLNPRSLVARLSVPQQQVVEIAKALSYNSNILIMDEPTASLTKNEISRLFETIRDLRAKGMGIIYISHRFEEIDQIGDRISVLRDGKYCGTMDVKGYDPNKLIQLMVGRSISDMYPRSHEAGKEVVLTVENLQLTAQAKPLSFKVHKGEIVGFAGLVGAGRTEVGKIVFGAMNCHAGIIKYLNEPLYRHTPKKSIQKGVIYLSEDRKSEGLVVDFSIAKNITLASLGRLFPRGIINRKKDRRQAAMMSRQLNVVARSIDQLARTLSGGNQQRVVIAKCLACEPKLMILDEPTRGIDIGAKAEIYEIINDIAKQGVAILFISSELPELIGMSDRIYVMHEGTIAGELSDRAQMTQEGILKYTVSPEKRHARVN
jgi:ABC-type sugar transport system ATPase subunit